MHYVLLIYSEEPTSPPSPEETDEIMKLWWEYDTAVKDSGVYVAAEALQPTQTATSLRVKGDERVVTDGPFAETREVLGGFYLIDVPDLDTALDWAARCPAAQYGTMEVRPVITFDAPPQ